MLTLAEGLAEPDGETLADGEIDRETLADGDTEPEGDAEPEGEPLTLADGDTEPEGLTLGDGETEGETELDGDVLGLVAPAGFIAKYGRTGFRRRRLDRRRGFQETGMTELRRYDRRRLGLCQPLPPGRY